jgi:hypothetical protein
MKRAFLAVIHATAKQFAKLVNLTNKVLTNLNANGGTFPAPDPPLLTLQSMLNTLVIEMGQAKTGAHQQVSQRNETAIKLLGLLQTEKNYVNKVAQGDKAIIQLSGFDASLEPSPIGVPDQMSIKKIVDGPLPLSAKIHLGKLSNPLLAVKPKYIFIVQMSTTPLTLTSWTTVLTTGNSRKLIIPNLVNLQEVYFRVAAQNTYGQGAWSAPIGFAARS